MYNQYVLPEFQYPTVSINFDKTTSKLYDRYNQELDQKAIDNYLNQNSTIILDFNRDHPNFMRAESGAIDAYNYYTSLGYKNLIFLTSDTTITNSNIRFFPSWLYCKSLQYQNLPRVKNIKRNHKLSCLNRFPSPHRVYLLYHLLKNSRLKTTVTSFHGFINPYANNEYIGELHEIYHTIPFHIKEFFLNNKIVKHIDDQKDNHWLYHPHHFAYSDCYLNLVTESTYYFPFFTEKTAKALFAEQLFVIAGGAGSCKVLENLGFWCYKTPNFNYDNIPDVFTRLDCIIDLLDNIYDDIESIYNDHIQELTYNSDYLISQTFRNKCLQQVSDLLK